MKKVILSPNRQYWVWVTSPDFYWDEEGEDRADIDPDSDCVELHNTWTCDRRTKRGDLVLLYRTSPMKDIAYLFQATSNAYSLEDDEFSVERGWKWGCDCRPMLKLGAPVTIAELREDKILKDWCAVRMQFQRSAFPIAEAEWKRLCFLICKSNPQFGGVLSKTEARPSRSALARKRT